MRLKGIGVREVGLGILARRDERRAASTGQRAKKFEALSLLRGRTRDCSMNKDTTGDLVGA